jgi:hypothetical protein
MASPRPTSAALATLADAVVNSEGALQYLI